METDVLLKESYRILEIFGGDPQSPLFHAEECAAGAPVVIRAFPTAELDGCEDDILREEELRTTLKHPALLPLQESWQEGNHRFQAFRCPSSTPLRKTLAAGISPSRALEIVRDLASTFKELHARGLCSGILSPDTVFLSEEGKPKLFHLGSPSSASIRTSGDHRYITPEQAQGKSADSRSDFYRLGLLLYEMLAGEAPYQAENSVQLTMLHLHGPPPKLPSALSRYQNLIDSLLAKEPLRRPADAEDVRRQIKLALNEKEPRLPAPSRIAARTVVASQDAAPAAASPSPAAAPLTPAPPRTEPQETKHRFYRGLGAAFALGAVLGASFLVLFMGPSNQGAPAAERSIDEDLKGRLLDVAKRHREGQTDEALKQLEALLSAYPQRPEPRNNLAVLLASSGELQRSGEVLSEAMSLDSRFATISENLEIVRQEIARRTYSKALNLEISQPFPELKILPIAGADSGDEVALSQQAVLEPPPVPEDARPERDRSPETVETRPAAPSLGPQIDLSEYAPEERDVIGALQSWAHAWSEEDVETYLDHYSRKFAPSDGLTLSQWKEQRRARLNRPQWISVTLEDFQVNATGPDTVQVKLIQEYRSDTYSDRSFKSMNLVREDGNWRIYLERTLGIIE